jgi:Icc-related predicted phosphoesterase
MRVAALYDIHGNVPALEAVLAEVRRERVDLVVVGGNSTDRSARFAC